MKPRLLKNVSLATVVVLLVLSVSTLIAIVTAGPAETTFGSSSLPTPSSAEQPRHGDEELAYLLVRLELKTQAVIGDHYTRNQSVVAPIDMLYKRWLTKNMILPAAVADNIFSEVVPQATNGRAWVKMVVDNPRNPNNRPDAVAKQLFSAIKAGAETAEHDSDNAYYYAEPIKSTMTCMRCHGETAGEPDPSFPQYKKKGWKPGEVVGAVVARVARLSE